MTPVEGSTKSQRPGSPGRGGGSTLSLRRIGRGIRTLFYRSIRFVLVLVYRRRPVPLRVMFALRRIGPLDKVLGQTLSGNASSLRNAFLARALIDEEFGAWALGTTTLNQIETWIRNNKATSILEMGSGVSTVCLARFVEEKAGEPREPRVFSIEQDPVYAQRTNDLLAQTGLTAGVKVEARELVVMERLGRRTECYNITPDQLDRFLQGQRPELVLIDGPAGVEGARLATLPLVVDHVAPHATVFMDDAFRDSELDTAKAWKDLPGVEILGVHMTDKGLLEARVTQP